ncbi:hypothetical protein J6V85_03295 [Candidatus Saccharibacteria bacterium]|nr:hypothetical protein [Candidatus Saccharibacteria bacterium]
MAATEVISVPISTIGAKIGYGLESTSGSKPATFTQILGVKTISAVNSEPEQLETTDLSQTQFKTYIPGLMDPGGTLTLTCNLDDNFQTQWEGIVSAAATGRASKLRCWFEIKLANMTKAFFVVGVPANLGINEVGVNAVSEVDAYVTLEETKGWDTAVTISPYTTGA